MQPELEFLAGASDYIYSSGWEFMDYAKLFGLSLIGVAATTYIAFVRKRDIAKENPSNAKIIY